MFESMSSSSRTRAQAEASRRNGRLSAGPVSPFGKIKVSTNGVVHGLRSERVVLAHEDPALYLERVQSWVDSLKPADEAELEVVISIADLRWRLHRLDQVEQNRTRAEALAQAEELSETLHLRRVEDAARATTTMAEVVASPNVRTDDDLTALLRAVRAVADMIRAVEQEVPNLFLGTDQLSEAAAMVAVLSIGEVDAEALDKLAAAASSTAVALGAELARARDAATAATEALAATVPLPDSKEMALLARYRRDLERRLESELRVLAAVRERKVQVAGTSGLVGQPIPVRLVG
jgi:hypothetical protein